MEQPLEYDANIDPSPLLDVSFRDSPQPSSRIADIDDDQYSSFQGLYFDIEDILAEEERIPTKYLIGATGMGYLDPSLDPSDESERDIKMDTMLEQPLWIAKGIYEQQSHSEDYPYLKLYMPKYLNKSARYQLRACAGKVNLNHIASSYFERVVITLTSLLKQEVRESMEIVREASLKRFRDILNTSLHAGNDDTSAFSDILTAEERAIFESARASTGAVALWKSRKGDRIEACPLLRRVAKRQRVLGSDN